MEKSQKKWRVERRKQKRYRTKKDAFAVVWPDLTRVGKIVDISMDGLAFSYMAINIEQKEASQVDILMPDQSVFLQDMPCRCVYDIDTGEDRPEKEIPMRKIGLQFVDIKRSHKSNLKSFINYYTTEG